MTASPFPGMNPYLEAPALWSGVHHRLITAIAIALAPALRPKYFVAVEERVYQSFGEDLALVGTPDDSIVRSTAPRSAASSPISSTSSGSASPGQTAIALASQPISVTVPIPEILTEGYLEIRRVGTEAVITVIEVLSPKNKRSGEGRKQYEAKRQTILGSPTHLVEIDLLRQWQPMLFFGPHQSCHYHILVSPSSLRPRADLYAFNLPDTIPVFPIPLQPEDAEPSIDLHALLNDLYDQGGYDLRLDYAQDPTPALDEVSLAWLHHWLQQQGLR